MAEQTNTKLQGTARISIMEIHSRATSFIGKQRVCRFFFLMDVCREKRIHLLRQFSSLLPSFPLKQRSASCATGEDTLTFHQGKHQHHFQHILPVVPTSGEQGEKKNAGFCTGRAGDDETWTPFPGGNIHSSPSIYVTEPFVHLDKVTSNFKATFILHAAALQFCVPGFMKQRQRKMRWQSAKICRHTCDLL